jgi:rhomboid family protein
MIPLKDDVPSRTPPVFTGFLIALNIVVFLYQLSLDASEPGLVRRGAMSTAEAFVYEFGLVPCRLTGACAWDFPHPFVTVFTSMFLHGGLLHVGGNMLYLWIFGNNIEDALGHVRFLVFYLACGVAAALSQTMMGPGSHTPMIGASGAVSGVLGAYLLLYPYARVLTLITFGFFIRFIQIPAIIVLGFWIVVQFANGLLSASVTRGEDGGVAWFAHIGGFLAGLVLVFVMRPARTRRL